MGTDEMLIDRLARDAGPIRPIDPVGVAVRWLVPGLIGAAIVTGWMLGFRPDLGVAVRTPIFWVKLAYALGLGIIAMTAVARLGRPEESRSRARLLGPVAAPIAVLALLAGFQLAQAPTSEWREMFLGASWRACSTMILTISLPVCGFLFAGLRRMAPARPGLAGASAGLAAGAFATMVYAFHCPESTALFVLTWYSGGIAAATLVGAIAGSRLLRW